MTALLELLTNVVCCVCACALQATRAQIAFITAYPSYAERVSVDDLFYDAVGIAHALTNVTLLMTHSSDWIATLTANKHKFGRFSKARNVRTAVTD